MTKRFTILCGGTTLLFAAQLALSCEYPADRPGIPDGDAATKEEILGAYKAVQQYVKDSDAYRSCLIDEEMEARAKIEDLTPEVEQKREEMLTKKHDASVEEAEKLAARFNEELHVWCNRTGDPICPGDKGAKKEGE